MSRWNDLEPVWQTAMGAAIDSYLNGSVPIAAVAVDSNGKVVSVAGNNHANNTLEHAETEVLKAVTRDIRRGVSLYTTMEPCPMCTGAIRLMKIRALHYATTDPAAGSSELLTASEFMRRFKIQVIGPHESLLEFVNVALILEFRTRTGRSRWSEKWATYVPHAVDTGEKLAAEGRYQSWLADNATPVTIFNEVAEYLPQ